MRWLDVAIVRLGIGLSIAAVAFVACVRDPVTGKRELILVSEAEEIAMGQSAAADVNVSMGLYPDESLGRYVQELGAKAAAQSERPQLPWQFRVVDSPVVNAFALPGGYIYLTRGILAHLSSEAALMGVVGHEIGHVTARHHVEQMSKQQLAGLGVGLGGIFFPEVRPFGDVLGGGLGLLFLKFGRDAERESDRLGVRYSLALGYDPTDMARFFAVLGRLSGSERRLPAWASTHPDPADRERTILRLVDEQALGRADLALGEHDYLERIDGLIHGENPREGFMRGRRFIHPDLAFRLDYPPDWRVQNTQTLVYAAPADGGAAIQLTATSVASGTSPEAHARAFFRQNRLEYGTGERLRIGPFRAYRAPFRARTSSTTIYGQAGFILDGELVYAIIGLTRANAITRYRPVFDDVVESFDRLRDARDLAVAPTRIRLFDVPENMTLERALRAARMSADAFEELSLLNNRALGETLTSGQTIKILETPDR